MTHNLSESVEKIGANLFPRRGIIWGAFSLLIFLFAQTKTNFFIVGLLLIIIGESFRVWGVGYIKNYRGPMPEVTELTTAGPYSHVRNPLYLANGIIGIGIALLSGLYYAIPLFLLIFFLLYHPIILAEELFLTKKFGEKYLRYCQKVPRYFPRFLTFSEQHGTFSWNVILIKETHTIVTLFILTTLFYLRGFGFLNILNRFFLGF